MYIVIKLSNVSLPAEDWLSLFAFECGASGMSEQLQFKPRPGTDEVESVITENKNIEIYFEESPSPAFFEEVRSRHPEIEFAIEKKENEDWMEGWKKHFKAFELVNGYWVVPSWLKAPSEAKRVLSIDPGMAFGTGTHETTSMMAEGLFWVNTEKSGESLLDVGTGTGILAILGSYLGYGKVVATDTDVEAQRVSKENFELNKVQVQIGREQVGDLRDSFDVVLANIIEGVLVLIREELFARVAPHGHLLLSGILKDNEDEFKKEFSLPQNFRWIHRLEKGEWLCLVAQREGL